MNGNNAPRVLSYKIVGHESSPVVERFDVSAFTVPTQTPEADGTLDWNQTTLIVVRASACGVTSVGYAYADVSTARLIDGSLKNHVIGQNALEIPAAWLKMVTAIRNLGRPGICAMAISAVDNSLWDLKARLLHLSVADLLGRVRNSIAAYGSGGFTCYSDEQLRNQLGGWVQQGMRAVKMKIGKCPAADLARVKTARDAIGPDADLFVDANGAYDRKQALAKAWQFADLGVTWFEEPVSSDDLQGLRLIREQGPPQVRIAAGEYGYDTLYYRRMLESGAVDVLQADATRCTGVTGFLAAGALCEAFSTPFSAHTAPTLHAHVACAIPRAINVEYFFDHYRIEKMFFEGALEPVKGMLSPDSSRPGFGIECKWRELEKYRVYGNPGQ
jgi:L-alanine-DL-glutamate epimerase-like enolase superfamily enzyme